jgi:hypothetical protein
MYLTLPETKGRSIEDLDRIFESKNPVKASLKTQEVIVRRGEGVVPISED